MLKMMVKLSFLLQSNMDKDTIIFLHSTRNRRKNETKRSKITDLSMVQSCVFSCLTNATLGRFLVSMEGW